jgi:hypothetical protein
MSRSYRIVEFDDGVDEYIVEFTIEGVTRTMLVAPVIDVDGVTINQELTRKRIQQMVTTYEPEVRPALRNPRAMVGTSENVTTPEETRVDTDALIDALNGD